MEAEANAAAAAATAATAAAAAAAAKQTSSGMYMRVASAEDIRTSNGRYSLSAGDADAAAAAAAAAAAEEEEEETSEDEEVFISLDTYGDPGRSSLLHHRGDDSGGRGFHSSAPQLNLSRLSH
jgi:hypothetical protein